MTFLLFLKITGGILIFLTWLCAIESTWFMFKRSPSAKEWTTHWVHFAALAGVTVFLIHKMVV